MFQTAPKPPTIKQESDAIISQPQNPPSTLKIESPHLLTPKTEPSPLPPTTKHSTEDLKDVKSMTDDHQKSSKSKDKAMTTSTGNTTVTDDKSHATKDITTTATLREAPPSTHLRFVSMIFDRRGGDLA